MDLRFKYTTKMIKEELDTLTSKLLNICFITQMNKYVLQIFEKWVSINNLLIYLKFILHHKRLKWKEYKIS